MPKSKESKPKDDTAQQPAQEEKPAANVEAEKQSKESTAESEGDEDSDEELEPGSLEKPIEILDRKSRERKSVSRFSTETVDSARKRPNLDYSAGKGTKLGEIEFVNWNIDNTPADDLKPLHRLLFRKAGKTVMVKRNIRQFCGFPFEKGTTLYAGMTKLVDRFTVAGLRFVAGILGTKKSQDKEEMKDSLVEFLMEPKDLGKEIPKRDEKKAKSKSPQKKPGKKASKKPADGASGSDASEASAGESGGEADGEKADEDKSGEEKAHEGETKKKKSKPTPVKIAPRKKDKPQASPKKPAKKAQKNERKRKESESEDDEPLSSKKPKKEPTDDEVRKVIKEILKDADLEQVTMKTVCKQIYDHYPDCDMTSRKDFIKATVKEIIS